MKEALVIDLPVKPPASPRGTSAALYAALFLDFVGFAAVLPLLPQLLSFYEADGRVSPLLQGFQTAFAPFSHNGSAYLASVLFAAVVGASYAFAQFLFSDVWSRISNLAGRKATLLTTQGIFLAACLAWAFAGTFEIFLIARAVAGAMGANLSVANATIADFTSPQTRQRGMGHGSIAITAGFTLGPALGTLAAAAWAPHPLPAAGMPWGLNPSSGAAFAVAGLAAFSLYLTARFLPWKIHMPAIDEAPFTPPPDAARTIRRVDIQYVGYNVFFSGATFAFAFVTLERFGLSTRANGLLFLLIGVGVLLTQGFIVPYFVAWWGGRGATVLAAACGVFGFGFMGWAGNFWLFGVGCAGVMLFAAIITPALMNLLTACVDADREARTLAHYRTLGALGRSGGTLLAGFLYFKLGALAAFTAAMLGLIPLGLAALRLPRSRTPNTPNASPPPPRAQI